MLGIIIKNKIQSPTQKSPNLFVEMTDLKYRSIGIGPIEKQIHHHVWSQEGDSMSSGTIMEEVPLSWSLEDGRAWPRWGEVVNYKPGEYWVQCTWVNLKVQAGLFSSVCVMPTLYIYPHPFEMTGRVWRQLGCHSPNPFITTTLCLHITRWPWPGRLLYTLLAELDPFINKALLSAATFYDDWSTTCCYMM